MQLPRTDLAKGYVREDRCVYAVMGPDGQWVVVKSFANATAWPEGRLSDEVRHTIDVHTTWLAGSCTHARHIITWGMS